VSREFEVARVQSDFVAAVSHEFRSPLTSMRHMIELLATGRVPDEEARDRFYDVLEREANRLQRLIEQLLDFRRLDEGAVSFDMQSIDGTSFIADVVADFRDNAAAHGHALEVSSNGSLPAIRADREALGRALLNLLENAVRYSPDCATVWLDVTTVDAQLEVTVRDRGIGIPEDEHARIFRKFVRGSGAQHLGARGTGLGLAMVDEIVQAHGGEVTLDSEPGEGSTFTIRLPLAESAS
jgi:signal transduction histidine kinase